VVITKHANEPSRCTRGDSPEWVYRAGQAGYLGHPDSILYYIHIEDMARLLKYALKEIDETEGDENGDYDIDYVIEIAREYIEPDRFIMDLTSWLDEFPDHIDYVTDILQAYPFSDICATFDTGEKLLAHAQYLWKLAVFDAIAGVLRDVVTN
jgi:hypothetical protein